MDDEIKRAVAAERERCARIARNEMLMAYERQKDCALGDFVPRQFHEGCAKGAQWVLKAIERGDEQ